MATRRRRANNIQDRMESHTTVDASPTPRTAYSPSSPSHPTSAPITLASLLSIVEPSPVNLSLFPLLLLSAYLYLHRAHLSLTVSVAMLVVTAAYLLAFVALAAERLRSKHSRWQQHALHDSPLAVHAPPWRSLVLLCSGWLCRGVVRVAAAIDHLCAHRWDAAARSSHPQVRPSQLTGTCKAARGRTVPVLAIRYFPLTLRRTVTPSRAQPT